MSGGMTHLAASLRGDREAFGEIIRQYQDMVCALTYSITGNLQQSEDLAQETFVTAWLKLKELRDETKFPAWLCGIARNLSQNWVRTNARQKTPLAQSELVEQLAAVPETSDRESQAALVWEILRELPGQYREPLVLYYQKSRTIGEIAAALDLTEANVRQRLSRGRGKIRAEVAQRVEQALETLRPGPGFTMAVLAAIPAMAVLTAQTAVASTATVATGSGGVLGKGASLAGVGIFAWLVGVIWIAFVSIVVPIAGIYAGMTGPLRQIRNSPTVRSRRFIIFHGQLNVGIAFFLMGAYFFVMSFSTEQLPVTAKMTWIVLLAVLFFENIIFSAMLSNKYWRKIIEQDIGNLPAPKKPLEKSWLSKRSLRYEFNFMLILVWIGMGWIYRFQTDVIHIASMPYMEYVFLGTTILIFLSMVGALIFLHVRGMKMASEEGLEKYPPTIPNIFDVVLHKAEIPNDKATLRARIGSDMLGMGILVSGVSASPAIFGLAQPNPWAGYVIIGATILGFLIFAKFIAGKPKVRHLGWAATCFFYMFFYGWIQWYALREPLARFPEMQLAVLFAYVLFMVAGIGGIVGYIGLFEKELNKKWGTSKKDKM